MRLQQLIEKIQAFSRHDVVKQFNESSKAKKSISVNPFSVTALNTLVNNLQKNGLSTFEQNWLLEEHLVWASASFSNEKATALFGRVINENKLTPVTLSDSVTIDPTIQVAINFNGTNNKIHTKHNRNDEVIDANHYDFKIQVPGVGSERTLAGDPVGLVEKEMIKYQDNKEHPFHLLFETIKPAWYKQAGRVLFGGLIQNMRIRNGNGTFYAAIYAAIKVYEIQRQYPDRTLKLHVFGHSRGSVSALILNFVLKILMDNKALGPVTVSLSLNDPVPGGDLSKPSGYKHLLKDDAFEHFKQLFPDFNLKGNNLVQALMESEQPEFVQKSLITYPVGDTRLMFSPLGKIPFNPNTESTIVLTAGSHNDPVYGSYPLSLLSLGLTEHKGYIARNMSTVPDKYQRRNIAIFYKQISQFFSEYSREESQTDFPEWLIENNKAYLLLETYPKFMVEGYATNVMTETYAVLQTDEARNPSILVKPKLHRYFMDTLHEALFKKRCPTLYDLLNDNPFYDVIREQEEFKTLPLSMKRVLLSEYQKNTESANKKPKVIDSLIPLKYLSEGLFGRKTRSKQLFTRQSYAEGRKRIPLMARYREEERVESNDLFLTKLPIKPIKNLECTYKKDLVAILKTNIELKLRNPKLNEYEKRFKLKTLEIIGMLQYYENKKIPTPLYLFYQKCPELLPVYLDSPLRQLWFCQALDEICPLEQQIELLERYHDDSKEPIEPVTIEKIKELKEAHARSTSKLG